MKRDLDLIRTILLDIEACPSGTQWEHSAYDGCDSEGVFSHLQILQDAGYIEGKLSRLGTGKPSYHSIRLTWSGHEFLAASRNPDLWSKAKETILSKTVSYTVPMLMDWLKEQAKGLLPNIS